MDKVKAKIAARKQAKKEAEMTEKKKTKKEKKVGRGRPPKKMLEAETKAKLEEMLAAYDRNTFQLKMSLEQVFSDGKKGKLKDARKFIQENRKLSGDFRKALQEAKANMVEVQAS
ncbi:MAG: hypothetical protein RBR32_03640 [Bacteroidales bacterium]|nr:hypothetical protein [Bacteroidales bacterium]